MLMAYATVDDLEARWKSLTANEAERAAVLLDDAAVIINALLASKGITIVNADAAKMVSCSMVKRAMMQADTGMMGITQGTVSADIYSQSLTFANPSGDMYITAAERKALGAGASYIASIPPVINPAIVPAVGV